MSPSDAVNAFTVHDARSGLLVTRLLFAEIPIIFINAMLYHNLLCSLLF